MADTNNRKNLTTIFQVVILVVLCAGVGGLLWAFGVFTPAKGYRNITLRIESSSSSVQVIYSLPGETSQDPMKATTPWDKSVSLKVGSEIYLEAANPQKNGLLRCSISIDGKLWKTQTVSYPEDKVTCAGILP
jgi:hypothetical protein